MYKLLLNDLSSFMSGLLDYHFGLFRPQNADIQYTEVLFFLIILPIKCQKNSLYIHI